MKPVEIRDLLDYTFYGNLKEKDGTVVFTAGKADEEKNAYTFHLMMVKDNQPVDLTTFGAESNFILEDADTVLFTGNRKNLEEKTVIYKIHTSGGEASQAFVLDKPRAAIVDVWQDGYLFSVSEYTGQETEEDFKILDEVPFYFNGSGYINSKRSHLYYYNKQTADFTALLPEDWNAEQVITAGDKLYFTGGPIHGKREMEASGFYAYDAKTGKTEQIVKAGKLGIFDFACVDGRLLVLASDFSRYGLNENPCLYALQNGKLEKVLDMDLAFGNTVGTDCQVVGGNASFVYQDTWYFTATEAENVHIFAIRNNALEKVLEWKGSINAFACSSAGIWMIAARPASLQQLYLVKDKNITQISDFNPDLAEHAVSIPQPLTYQGYDGSELTGWILYPKDFQPDKKYPAILDIHGGPKTVYGTVFYHEMQVWASRGFFVLFCNPHGSDGFGNAYADLRGKYGTIDYDDIQAFVDACLKAVKQIDSSRLGVTGGSYGGFMTNWIITHTDRFKAAASQRSISNWISFATLSDIGESFVKDQQQADLHDIQSLWKQSPLAYVDNCTTPTLFIHSDEDFRCPLEQGQQMVCALLQQNKTARLVQFHKENHDLSRSGRPKSRLKRLEEITNWMEHYLM